MAQSDYIDDLMLAAFVDGQLDPGNCESVLATVENDSDTRERLYQLRRAKDLMKIGFEHVEAPAHRFHRGYVPCGRSKCRRIPDSRG